MAWVKNGVEPVTASVMRVSTKIMPPVDHSAAQPQPNGTAFHVAQANAHRGAGNAPQDATLFFCATMHSCSLVSSRRSINHRSKSFPPSLDRFRKWRVSKPVAIARQGQSAARTQLPGLTRVNTTQ